MCTIAEMRAVTPRPLVLSVPADSMRTSSNILATPRCRDKACAQLVPVLAEHWTGRGRKKKLSENWLRAPGNVGGADEDRTHDLLNAIQALSQTELRPHGT